MSCQLGLFFVYRTALEEFLFCVGCTRLEMIWAEKDSQQRTAPLYRGLYLGMLLSRRVDM